MRGGWTTGQSLLAPRVQVGYRFPEICWTTVSESTSSSILRSASGYSWCITRTRHSLKVGEILQRLRRPRYFIIMSVQWRAVCRWFLPDVVDLCLQVLFFVIRGPRRLSIFYHEDEYWSMRWSFRLQNGLLLQWTTPGKIAWWSLTSWKDVTRHWTSEQFLCRLLKRR